MKKACETCQYLRAHQFSNLENMPEPPWCSNSKSPFYWKTVKPTDVCGAWEDKTAKGIVGVVKNALRKKENL